MANDDLHKPLKSINQTIKRLREDVQSLTGEVKKIRDAIIEAAKRVQDAIHENIQAQAELKLMEHVMEVKSVKPQIEAEHEQIRTERDELEERLDAINERYADKHRELDETARERVRDLGSHIFAIDEEEFEAGIERPFTEQVTATWGALQGHNEIVGEERTTAVRETTGETVQAIHDYIDRQERLLDRIEDHRLNPDSDALPTDEETTLQVPYYIIEYEQEGVRSHLRHDPGEGAHVEYGKAGVRSRQKVVPSRLSGDGTEWCSVSLEPVEGAESLMNGVSGVESPARTSRLGPDELAAVLDEYGKQSPFGISYTDAVIKAVPDEWVEVAREVDD